MKIDEYCPVCGDQMSIREFYSYNRIPKYEGYTCMPCYKSYLKTKEVRKEQNATN